MKSNEIKLQKKKMQSSALILEVLALFLFFIIILDVYLDYGQEVEFIEYEDTFSHKKKSNYNYTIFVLGRRYNLVLGKSNVNYKNLERIKENDHIVYSVRSTRSIIDFWNTFTGKRRIVALESSKNGLVKSTTQYLERRQEMYVANIIIVLLLILFSLLIVHSWIYYFIDDFENSFSYFNNPLISYKKKKGVPPQK